MQARFRSSRGIPLPFGRVIHTTTSEGKNYPSHPSNQQSAIRERLGDSLVSMIRRYRGGGGGVSTTTTTGGDGVMRTCTYNTFEFRGCFICSVEQFDSKQQ